MPLGVSFAALVGFSLLDLKVINLSSYKVAGSFIGTIVASSMFAMGILIAVLAFYMDNMKNEVISTDSDVNVNYNRAKKKTWADLNVLFLWINTLYMIFGVGAVLFENSGMLMFIGIGVYMALIMGGMIVFAILNRTIEENYKKEINIVTDDDEYWIGGTIYCNPNDKRTMVEKRGGIGATINLATPAGKFFGILTIGCLVVALLSLVWVGMVEITPISVRVEDGAVICHQLKDDYVINLDDIESVELGEDIKTHDVIRSSGVGMETLLKGNFMVDGDNGCILFLNPSEKVFIRIETKDGKVYYIGSDTADETRGLYEMIK